MKSKKSIVSLNESWRKQDAFDTLCDLVASDKLVCMTGAGISYGLKRKDGRGRLPGWLELLRGIRKDILDITSTQDLQADVDRLLYDGAFGSHLIEAATLLRTGREEKFDRAIRTALTPAKKQPPVVVTSHNELHDALINLRPRGIITYNVDSEHERALQRRKLSDNWQVLIPNTKDGELKLGNLIRHGLRQRFLLKAHGSIDSVDSIVFTFDSYRDLIERNPVYRSFFQNVFTNFSLLIVGFGLSDLDFDLFKQTVALQFGSPLQRHVAIRLKPSQQKGETKKAFQMRAAREYGEEVALRRRFGICTLMIEDYSEIPGVLNEAAITSGPSMREALDQCLSADRKTRHDGQTMLRSLGPAGKALVSADLRGKIKHEFRDGKPNLTPASVDNISELVYSLGIIRPEESDVKAANKELLLQVLEQTQHVEIAAHALSVLEFLLESSDIPKLEKFLRRVMNNKLRDDGKNLDPDNRLPVYTERLILLLRAKNKDFSPRADAPLLVLPSALKKK